MKMKRTAKWMKALTIKELKHMQELQSTLTLKDFKSTRIFQKDLEAKFGSIACWECRCIERKLKESGTI